MAVRGRVTESVLLRTRSMHEQMLDSVYWLVGSSGPAPGCRRDKCQVRTRRG
jgi:hypothetical protein